MFASAHGYLALLNLSSDDVSEAVELVRDCWGKASDPYADIGRMLADPNWRPHLVAAVAVIVSGYHADVVNRLWLRLDSGSWVTPQIGAALFLIDPDFAARARVRLEAGCPIDVTQLLSLTPPERHSAAGPAGTVHRSAKAAATLLRLLQMTSPLPDWVQNIATSEAMQALLAQDIDRSDTIAERWLQRIKEITGDNRH